MKRFLLYIFSFMACFVVAVSHGKMPEDDRSLLLILAAISMSTAMILKEVERS